MHKIRIGGVPEHFNHPWLLAIEQKRFLEIGVDVEWIVFKGGTGAMTNALRNNKVDFCVVLTEGIIKDIAAGNKSKIISHYVESPLTWGIYSGAKNNIRQDQIFEKKIAISRFGSGSHLMPQIHASESKKSISEKQFHVIKNLNGAIKSLTSLDSDVFYWEKFTTKPYVDKGFFKKVGEFKPPWPCFVIAGRESSIEKFNLPIQDVLTVVFKAASNFYSDSSKANVISEAYNIQKNDVSEWFNQLEWTSHQRVNKLMIKNVLNLLKSCEMIDDKSSISADQLVYEFK